MKRFAADKIIHERARLLILTHLASSDCTAVAFSELQERLGLTSGNLSVQLKTLKDTGYVAIKKQFKNNKPLTTASITPKGSHALMNYVEEMKRIINSLEK